ncbi:hypothetical protein Tcan_01658, partial [Toxocara canis]
MLSVLCIRRLSRRHLTVVGFLFLKALDWLERIRMYFIVMNLVKSLFDFFTFIFFQCCFSTLFSRLSRFLHLRILVISRFISLMITSCLFLLFFLFLFLFLFILAFSTFPLLQFSEKEINERYLCMPFLFSFTFLCLFFCSL